MLKGENKMTKEERKEFFTEQDLLESETENRTNLY